MITDDMIKWVNDYVKQVKNKSTEAKQCITLASENQNRQG